MRPNLPGLLTALVGAACLIAACGGGTDSVAPSPSPSGPPDLSPRVGAVDAMRRYLRETGVDGRNGDLIDPADCAALDGGDGDFCIIDDASVYAPGLVILWVADVDHQEEDVWEVHLEPGTNAWEVVQVESLGDQ